MKFRFRSLAVCSRKRALARPRDTSLSGRPYRGGHKGQVISTEFRPANADARLASLDPTPFVDAGFDGDQLGGITLVRDSRVQLASTGAVTGKPAGGGFDRRPPRAMQEAGPRDRLPTGGRASRASRASAADAVLPEAGKWPSDARSASCPTPAVIRRDSLRTMAAPSRPGVLRADPDVRRPGEWS